LRRLRQENDYLRRQREIFKKSLRHLVGQDATAGFRVMETMKREGSIDELAEALEVSKSGFYAHLRKSQRPRRRGDQRLRSLIHSSFERSRATYGCLRIRWDLRELGERCGKNRVARLRIEL
jgi:putative transposase